MIAKVLPAIVARWPREDAGKTIWIQQDNARTHIPVDDEQFAQAVAQTGLDIRLINQPANSPRYECPRPRILHFSSIVDRYDNT
jgi:hypothetical protein